MRVVQLVNLKADETVASNGCITADNWDELIDKNASQQERRVRSELSDGLND